MNCVSESMLRSYRDNELDGAERVNIVNHLADCAICRSQLQEIESSAIRVGGRLLSLDDGAEEPAVDANAALARFKGEHVEPIREPISASRLWGGWRLAWIGGAAFALLAVFLAFPSGRSLAQKLLDTLRVEKIQPVSLDMSALNGPNAPLAQMLTKMLSDKLVVTASEDVKQVSSAADASQLLGFSVRLPSNQPNPTNFVVVGRHAFSMTLDRERLQDILDQTGHSDLLLPSSVDGATVSVVIPRFMAALYGDCPKGESQYECVILQEATSPTVNVPANLNIQQLAEIGLQVTGMTAMQAQQFCQMIDWKNTLVLPVPRGFESYSKVQVDGVEGTLVSNSDHGRPSYLLMWVKDGIIYGLQGPGDSEGALAIANSLN
jgi:hypothetical protein